jgi:hypothetical protein
MTPAVSEAIDEIKAAYPAAVVTSRDDGSGGAFVTVDPVDPGEIYNQRETWIGFQITFQYPYSDVYPLFVRPDLSRVDGQQLGEGMTLASFDNKPAIQISRRSNRLNPESDTAEIKLMKVLEWLRHR